MSSLSKHAELQSNLAVNNLLSSLLPGAQKISSTSSSLRKPRNVKRSKAQLIDQNMKKRVELQERDVSRLRKRERNARRQAIKTNRGDKDKIEQLAKLKVLESHKLSGNLTAKEQKYLNKLIKKNAKSAKSWDLEEDDKEELRELQHYILDQTFKSEGSKRSKDRRKKVKTFKEAIKSSSSDHRYPGLTPGLAPVGLSDEEESSDEE